MIELLMSVVMLASGVVLVLQALAKSSQVLTIAERRSDAYRVTLSKMADLELAFREDREIAEETRGTARVGVERAVWHVSAVPLPGAPDLRSVSLRVVWPYGKHTYEERFETLLRATPAGS